MDLIRKWYNGKKRDYKKGVHLYMVYGADIALKRSFLEKETHYKMAKLAEELLKLISPKPFIRVPVAQTQDFSNESKSKHSTTIHQPLVYRWSSEPDEIERSIHARWKLKYVEMMDMVSRVGDVARLAEKDFSKRKEAAEMALKILSLDDDLEELYAERNFYIEKGEEKVSFPYGEPCHDHFLMPQKLQNSQRYVREYRAKLSRDPLDSAAAVQLKKHQWFANYYKSQLRLSDAV